MKLLSQGGKAEIGFPDISTMKGTTLVLYICSCFKMLDQDMAEKNTVSCFSPTEIANMNSCFMYQFQILGY